MVRPPWPNSTNRNSWLRPSAFHHYQVWPHQESHQPEQPNPFGPYNQFEVGHFINPNIVQPTMQSQRVTAMKLEISPELPIQPSIQGNKLFVAVPAEARTIGEFKEHVAAILNVSSSIFHFTTGEFRIPDEEVIGILSCISEQRINVVRSLRNWPVPETASRPRFPPQHVENGQHSAATRDSPPSQLSRMRSPPRLTHPLPCRPPRISPKHVPSSSNDAASEVNVNLPAIPIPMTFSQMKYRTNKGTNEDLSHERLSMSRVGESTNSLNKRTLEPQNLIGNGTIRTSSTAVPSHNPNISIPVSANAETEQSESTTPEIQVTDGSCTVYQLATATTANPTTGKLTVLYCETINDNVNVPGTSANSLSAVLGAPSSSNLIESLPKDKTSNGLLLNGNSQWNGLRVSDNNETITSAFASISTSNSPLNLTSVTKSFSVDNNGEPSHNSHIQMPNIAERDLSNEQRQAHSTLSHFHNINANGNIFGRTGNNRSAFVFGSTSPLVGSSGGWVGFRSVPISPQTSTPNDLTRSSSERHKLDLFGTPTCPSAFIRAEPSTSGTSRTPWNIYRTFGNMESESSKVFNVPPSREPVQIETDNIQNTNSNQNHAPISIPLTGTHNHNNRSPGIIQTKRRRICAIDSVSLAYLNDNDKVVDDESSNKFSVGNGDTATASTSKQAQISTDTHSHSHSEKRSNNRGSQGNLRTASCGSQTSSVHKSLERSESNPSSVVKKNGKISYMGRSKAQSCKNFTSTAPVDASHSHVLVQPSLGGVARENNTITSKSNNLILEDIESEDSELNELSKVGDDVKIVCELGKEVSLYSEGRPITRPEDIAVGSLVIFNEKIGGKDDCDCMVLSAHKWAKVMSIDNTDDDTSFMLWYFSPYVKTRSQTNDKKDYVRLSWDDLVDPRIVVTKGHENSGEESE